MSNFSPKLEDSTDKQLMYVANELDPNYGSLASDELTRRTLKKLQGTLEKFDKNTQKYSRRLIDLTIVLFVVAIIQVVVSLGTISASWREWTLLIIIFLYILYCVIKYLLKNK